MPRLRQPVAMKKGEPFDSEKAAQLLEEQNKKEEETPPEPQLEAVAEDTPPREPVRPPVEEPKQDDAALALKKQLEQIRESEALIARVQQERDEAIRRLKEQELERARLERQTVQSQYESVGIALKAAKEKLDFAERDLRAAKESGDIAAEIEATKRMTQANAEIMTLEPGRDELKDKRRSEKKKFRELRDQYEKEPQLQQQRQPTVEEIIAKSGLPEAESQWLRNHPDFVTDPKKWQQLSGISSALQARGIGPGHPEFLPYIDGAIEYFAGGAGKMQPEPAKKAPIVSAPVSREVPSGGSGRRANETVTLTAEEREFAKISNITEAEYARQKQRLLEAKANGQYTGGQ